MAIIHGPRSKCIKSVAYDATLPLMSLHQTRDRAEHDRRRRVWDKGFSTKGTVITVFYIAKLFILLHLC
jgi:hypothetical protein